MLCSPQRSRPYTPINSCKTSETSLLHNALYGSAASNKSLQRYWPHVPVTWRLPAILLHTTQAVLSMRGCQQQRTQSHRGRARCTRFATCHFHVKGRQLERRAQHSDLWCSGVDRAELPHYNAGASFLRSIGFTNAAEISRVLDVAMNPNSLYLKDRHKRRAFNASVSLPHWLILHVEHMLVKS